MTRTLDILRYSVTIESYFSRFGYVLLTSSETPLHDTLDDQDHEDDLLCEDRFRVRLNAAQMAELQLVDR